MKKLILSLFLFCSVFAFSQGTIPIPQIIGLPAALASKVDKVTGKSLVTDTSIVKLTGVQAGAQVNKIEGIQKNGADLTITGKKVNITVPTTASDISAEPANTNIQSHISSTSNPHSVTKSQVGLGNVDNTSDINKPISTATQTALDGKQLIGTYATGTGTANGTNTGDETLTSIKTKLGAATSVSDGYLKYQDYVKLNGNNLTSSLTTNYIPKWNGSSMVNSLISDNGTNAQLGAGTPFTTGAKFNIIGTSHGLISQTSGGWGAVAKNTTTKLECDLAGTGDVSVQTNGRIVTTATTPSTSPTTGALVVGGGIGADHVRANNFYGSGSNLTGVQLPITLTTNGTSGAATFENGVMNVPNYGNVATSGTYVPALTNYSNIASSLAFEAMYMHIGNMYSLSIKVVITPSVVGYCILQITLPQQSNNKAGVFSVTSISNDYSTVLPSFTYTEGSGDYVGVGVTVPSTAPITLTVTGMYTHQ